MTTHIATCTFYAGYPCPGCDCHCHGAATQPPADSEGSAEPRQDADLNLREQEWRRQYHAGEATFAEILDRAEARAATPVAERQSGLREVLAALEHEQWEQWSRTVAEQGLTPERIERWQRFWVPYTDLDEPTKDHDRVWADKVLAIVNEYRAALAAPAEPRIDVERLGEIRSIIERARFLANTPGRRIEADRWLGDAINRLARLGAGREEAT